MNIRNMFVIVMDFAYNLIIDELMNCSILMVTKL